ncbi:MAG: UDP-2,4-diacetamido-2,4,6-trideoxy-beta-L-altropyranose hydrolase [Thermoguttaceae bacterium]|jgi:UDP-2,4-diacetamido-2,4,6-trideoxy-beta-L-altropyranose hydrolase
MIRADANSQLGTGHVMRCLGLAHAWQDRGGRVGYLLAAPAAEIRARLDAEDVDVFDLPCPPGGLQDAAATACLAQNQHAAWIVVDGYQFGGDYQRAIHEAAVPLLVLDDYGHADHYWADLVLNQDLNAEEQLYRSRESYTRLLLGPEYVLLRREFVAARRKEHRPKAHSRKVLVTLGGADPENLTRTVIEALAGLGGLAVESRVVVGPANPRYGELEAAAAHAGPHVEVLRNVRNMVELMSWCDIAITGGGSTLWELASLCVPSLVLILADNQRYSARLLEQRGGCRIVGEGAWLSAGALSEQIAALLADQSQQAALGQRIGAIVDGRGAQRVCEAMEGADRL